MPETGAEGGTRMVGRMKRQFIQKDVNSFSLGNTIALQTYIGENKHWEGEELLKLKG